MSGAPRFVLASASPRREQLLRDAGLSFAIDVADVAEVRAAGEAPADYALRVALDKARSVAGRRADGLAVLGADTDVVVDGEILGKPRDAPHAVAMLLRLSARSHQVYTAVAVVQGARTATALTVTEVEFGPISAGLAERYWATGEPAGKAGAYAIQGVGARLVRAIRGSYTGVVGLPLCEALELLGQFGIGVLPPVRDRDAAP